MILRLLFSIVLCLSVFVLASEKYNATWESIDSRPLPAWFDDAKIGIFIHWSVWSVPAAGFNESAYLWIHWITEKVPAAVDYMNANYRKGFTYPEFAANFKATFYDPTQWVDIFNASGAKYVVFVSKHHEGYCNWPSKHAFNWNSMDVGPKRDLLGDLFNATRTTSDLKIGLYYSLYEWYNQLYVNDRSLNFTTDAYVRQKMMPELMELTNTYQPDVIWTDGDWEAYPDYWKSLDFLAWLYNDSPVRDNVVVNDRWGIGTLCQHGGFLTCSDRYSPGHLIERKWENAMTLDLDSWGYRHNVKLENIIRIEDLIKEVVVTVSCGGNILINIGPTADGIIPVIFEERLRQLGSWLKINGEAIYSTRPWEIQTDPLLTNRTWYTCITDDFNIITNVYVTLLEPPNRLVNDKMQIILQPSINCTLIQGVLVLGVVEGATNSLQWSCNSTDSSLVYISFQGFNFNNLVSKWAWVLNLNFF